MIWICGWCVPGQRTLKEIEPFTDFGVTHGMCEACAARLEEETRIRREAREARRKGITT